PTTTIDDTDDPTVIASGLAEIRVRFERWDLAGLDDGASTDEVLAAYADDIVRISAEQGYTHVDAVGLRPTGEPGWAEQAAGARSKFPAEHTHADDEDRFFARGSGIFYLHHADRVHAVKCEAGDVLSVPAGTTHWFDMGTSPDFLAVRFFHDEEGWVGDFTGNPIAERFPDYDTLAAA